MTENTQLEQKSKARSRKKKVSIYFAVAVGAGASFAVLAKGLPAHLEVVKTICEALAIGIPAALGIFSPGLHND